MLGSERTVKTSKVGIEVLLGPVNAHEFSGHCWERCGGYELARSAGWNFRPFDACGSLIGLVECCDGDAERRALVAA